MSPPRTLKGEFARSGFFGPLSRYRNHTRDFRYLQAFKDRTLSQPAFFIAGNKDGAFKVEAPGPHAGRFGELRAAAAAAGRLGLQQARVGAVESGRRLGGDGKCGRRGGPEPKGLHEEKHLG